LLFTHEQEDEVQKGAKQVKRIMEAVLRDSGQETSILGPAPAPLSKIKDRYRWQLVLKAARRQQLLDLIGACLGSLKKNKVSPKLGINVDVNPQGML
jgi:primosomal protein N' (replication factor Y)